MKTIDVTPIMTSNTTPAPYVVSASAEFNQNYKAFNAFDNITSMHSSDGWVSTVSTPKWLKIDFSEPTYINAYKITTRGTEGDSNPPKDWVLEGSNDDVYWDVIHTVTDGFTVMTPLQSKIFVCGNAKYRYYRLNIKTQLGTSGYTCIGQLRFLDIEDDTPIVTNTNAYHAQTVPMNTTNNIVAKRNDPREGLLGMANDPENYGDLYVVGRDGRSHLTKSGIKSEVIFEGTANVASTEYKLSKSIKKFKQLLIIAGASYNKDPRNGRSFTFDVSDLNSHMTSHAINLTLQVNSSSFANTSMHFKDEFTFVVDLLTQAAYTNHGITKIIGIC